MGIRPLTREPDRVGGTNFYRVESRASSRAIAEGTEGPIDERRGDAAPPNVHWSEQQIATESVLDFTRFGERAKCLPQ